MALSVTQREAIRQLAEGTPGSELNSRTMKSLMRLGYSDGTSLTPAGERRHAKIMSSGDGPERLKDMFRF